MRRLVRFEVVEVGTAKRAMTTAPTPLFTQLTRLSYAGSVTKPELTCDLVVALDYGQFSLRGSPSSDADYTDLLEEAIDGPDIAGDGTMVVVRSPHQNNFRMPLRVEVWPDNPPDDSDSWEEIFECALTVEGGALYFESPTMETTVVEIPDGQYAVRIHGRGFVNRGWPGSTTPGDVWQITLWPGDGKTLCRHVKVWGATET
jgi:hypothetical protein